MPVVSENILFTLYLLYFFFFVKLWIIKTSLHVCCAPHLTFKFTQPFDMEITKALRQLSASFGFRTSAEILQHWNIFTQTYACTHTHTHTLLSPLKRASLCLIPCEVYLLSQMSTLAVDTLCFLHLHPKNWGPAGNSSWPGGTIESQRSTRHTEELEN